MSVVRTRRARRSGPAPPCAWLARATLAGTLLPVALLAGCADEDETLPAVEKSSSSGADGSSESAGRPSRTDRSGGSAVVSAPKGADLKPDQQAAYDKAVTDHDGWVRAALDMQANPAANAATNQNVHSWALDPYATQFMDKLRRLEQHNVTVRGRAEVLWRVPVSVDLDARWPQMTWRECDGDGSIRVAKDGEPVEQTDTTPHASELTLRVDASGRWRPMISKDLGPCDG